MQAPDPGLLFRSEADLHRNDERQTKLARMQRVGNPISLGSSKALSLAVEGNSVWTAESNGTVVKRDLETAKVIKTFRGHRGPVSALCLGRDAHRRLVITGSWDKCLRVFHDETGQLLSCTEAHEDFVKALAVMPQQQLIVSGGSDKEIRFWDLASEPPDDSVAITLKCVGSLRAHTRPISCLAVTSSGTGSVDTLYSADSMGVLMSWRLEILVESAHSRKVRATPILQINGHSTGLTDMRFGFTQLWTSSSDQSVLLHHLNKPSTASSPPIRHPAAVKAILVLSLTPIEQHYLITGCSDEKIRVWDIAALEDGSGQAELVRELDVHAHEITGIELWLKRRDGAGQEPWVITASLDGTLRRWKLADLLARGRVATLEPQPELAPMFELSREEELELLELE